MLQDAVRLIQDLAEALGPRADDAAAIEAATGIPAAQIGRILRREEDPRIDHLMALARCCGYAAMPSCRPAQWTMPRVSDFREKGVRPLVAGDLAYLRDVFVSWRKTTGLSPTGMARICGAHEKTFLRIESGDRLPRLGSVVRHAAHFGLSFGLFPEGRAHALRGENETRRRKLAPGLRRRIEDNHRSAGAPPPSAADALVAAITACADRNDVSVRQIAAYAGLDSRTLIGRDRSLDPTGLFATTAKVAAVLDLEIVAVPADAAARVEEVARLHEAVPMVISPDDIPDSVRRQSGRIVSVLDRLCCDMTRQSRPKADVAAVRALSRSVGSCRTAHLAERLRDIGFDLMAVPADVASKVGRIAEQMRTSPRKPRRAAAEQTRDRNDRLVSRFLRELGQRLDDPEEAGGLPHRRPRLQIVLDAMARTRLALDVVDRETGQRVLRYEGREAGDFFGHIIDLRIARGYSLHAIGAGVNLTHSAVRRAERPEARPQAQLSSILRYAEAIGLDVVPTRP